MKEKVFMKRKQSRGDTDFAKVLTMLVLLMMAVTGAWAQNVITLTPNNTRKVWTLSSMPVYDVTLKIVYEDLALVDEEDNTTKLTNFNGYEADVTVSRTLNVGSYNTFSLPFNTAIPSGWTVKELSGATLEDGVLNLAFANASSIKAGKPYLVKVAANTDLSLTPFVGVEVSKSTSPFTSDCVDFIPTLGTTTIQCEDVKTVLILGAANKLYNPDGSNPQIKGFRAYFLLKDEAAQARAFRMTFDDEATGITTVLTDEPTKVNGTYDLQGRKIEGKLTQKGVYIVNGKKTVIK